MARKRRNKGPNREEILEFMVIGNRVYKMTEIKRKGMKTTWKISWEGNGKRGQTFYDVKAKAESRWNQMTDNDFIIGYSTC